MRQPYTGCNPRGMMLSRDKVLSKQILSYHRIATPQFGLFRRGRRPRIPKRLRYPLFVKSATEDASLGIAQATVVEDEAARAGTVSPGSPRSRKKGMPAPARSAATACSPRSMNPNWRAPAPRKAGTRLKATASGAPAAAAWK